MTNTNRLDTLTTTVTAFNSYADLAARCGTGYTPSLRVGNAKQAKLGRALERDGHRVFWG